MLLKLEEELGYAAAKDVSKRDREDAISGMDSMVTKLLSARTKPDTLKM